MIHYLWLVLVVVGVNLLPAFAPPTWSVLLYFTLSYHSNDAVVVVLGVLGATLGRALLSLGARRARRVLPRRYVENVARLGERISEKRGRVVTLWLTFLVAPISSAQLFVAAGVMGTLRLVPLLVAFALGRTVSYSLYVTGAHLAGTSSLGPVLVDTLRSPEALLLQVALILLVGALGLRDWTSRPRS